MSRLYWLSTPTMLRCCHSIANAVAIGKTGDHIHAHDAEANAPASFPSHVIHITRTGRKVARRLSYSPTGLSYR